MNPREAEFLQLEEELMNARKKLNALVYDFHLRNRASKTQTSQEADHKALYQEKINHLEAELQYLQRQMIVLKRMQPEVETLLPESDALYQRPQDIQTSQALNQQTLKQPLQQTPQPALQSQMSPPQPALQSQTLQPQPALQPQVLTQLVYERPQSQTIFQKASRKPQEYEKIFGKSFMGIFASVLIFISLIIFATLVLPYLTDTVKLIGLYVLSFGILGAGLSLYHKHRENKFFIAIIGCGAGSLYLSLLLSDLYFKVIGDIALYCFILAWAILVKYLTRLKNLVFQIIGQVGVFIATILGTVLCVTNGDGKKYFVLTVFYLLSACVFSNLDILSPLHIRKSSDGAQGAREPLCYEHCLCNHISKTLNSAVFLLGFALMDSNGFRLVGILLLMFQLLLEYFFSYRETCRHGLAFQILCIANALLLICFFNVTELLTEDYSYLFMYLLAIGILVYVGKKASDFRLFSQVCCLILVFVGCVNNPWIREHLYAYLTVIPFLLYGKWKSRKLYLTAGVVYLALLWVQLPFYEYSGYSSIEHFMMMAAVFAAFLYTFRKMEHTDLKVAGYIMLCFAVTTFTSNMAFQLLNDFNPAHIDEIYYISSRKRLICFFVISLMHLVLNKLEYFGKEKPVEEMMTAINAMLMLAGCSFMHDMPWQLPTILITVLLFLVNSKRLLPKHKYAGYYIAFKYTALMVSILTSFDVVNYVISICLLLFAIFSIVTGFYKDMISFRLYGLVLSMISIIKLIIIDISYDSTLENALSFFVSGVLCFIISFIYHKIDTGLKKK